MTAEHDIPAPCAEEETAPPEGAAKKTAPKAAKSPSKKGVRRPAKPKPARTGISTPPPEAAPKDPEVPSGQTSAEASAPAPAVPPLDPTVPPPDGEKPIFLNPFAPSGSDAPSAGESIATRMRQAVSCANGIAGNAPALCGPMRSEASRAANDARSDESRSADGPAPAPTPPSGPQSGKSAKTAKKAKKKGSKAASAPSSAPSCGDGPEVPSDNTAAEKPGPCAKTSSKAAPRLRFRVEDAPAVPEKSGAPKGRKAPLTALFALSEADAEVLTADDPDVSNPQTPSYAAPQSSFVPTDASGPADEGPEAERLPGRRASLPRRSEERGAEGETLLSPPRAADVSMGRIARRALERTAEHLAGKEGRPVPKSPSEERAAQMLRAPHDVRPEDPDSLESVRRAMRAEEEVEAVLAEILESSRSVEEANAKMNRLLSELTACDPVRNPDGTTHYRIRDPEAFRRSILFSQLLLLPDLRTGPTWMRSVIRARSDRGCALRLTEALTLELDSDALPEDAPLRLDDSGVFVERTSETPPAPNPAVTMLLTKGDPVGSRRRARSAAKDSGAAPLAGSVGSALRDGERVLRTAPPGTLPQRSFPRSPWDAGVRLLQVSVLLGVAFVGGLLGGRAALSDPGLLHTDRLAFVDLTSVAKSGFPDAEGFPEAFRAVLNRISEERGVVLVAKNFLLTGPAPETRERDLTVEVITGLIDRLGMPGERGVRVPAPDLPKEVERVLTPSSTEAANDRVRRSGAFDDPLARGRGGDALGVPYVKPLPEDASRTLFATEHAARASRLSALEAEKSAREATRAAEDLRREIERRKAERTLRETADERLGRP